MADFSSFFNQLPQDNVPSGVDQGDTYLVDQASYQNCVCAEYIWVGGLGGVRSKTKTLSHNPTSADDCPVWSFDGSATFQADADSCDVYLVPRRIFVDPIKGSPNILVVCEAVTLTMEPAAANYRADCERVMSEYSYCDAWFSMEQQYTLMKLGALGADKQPVLGTDGKYSADDATWYCSRNVDKDMTMIREFSETHYALCLAAGVKIQSAHIGRTLSSGSFTIGPCRGLNIGDHLIAARWLCGVVDERFKEFFCSFDPLPAGAGGPGKALFTSFSSRQTRNEGGSQILEKCARALARENKKHLPAYGEGNNERLTGENRNPSADTFTYAVSDRTASVMIPRNVAVTGRGDLVDRRVGSNADPYRVAGVMMSTMAVCLKQASLKES